MMIHVFITRPVEAVDSVKSKLATQTVIVDHYFATRPTTNVSFATIALPHAQPATHARLNQTVY
jgi:hypothetical protein